MAEIKEKGKKIVKELLNSKDFMEKVKERYKFNITREEVAPDFDPLKDAVDEALYHFLSERFTEIEEGSPTIWEYVKEITTEDVEEALSSPEYYKKRKQWGGPNLDDYIGGLLINLSKGLKPKITDKLREKKYKKKLKEVT